MADLSRTQVSGRGPAPIGAGAAAQARPPDPPDPVPTNNKPGSSILEKNAAPVLLPNNIFSSSSLYPVGKGTKADFWDVYVSLNQDQSERKSSMCSQNRISVSVQNSRLKKDGSLENTSLTHMMLFQFLINRFDLDIE